MKKIAILVSLFCLSKIYGQYNNGATADSLFATGNYIKAINQYSKIGSTTAGLQIARAYNAIGIYPKAIVAYEAVLQRDSTMQLAQFELGKLLLKTNTPDAARKHFNQLVNMANDNPEYHYYLAEAFRELDQPSSSLVFYKKAVHRDSTHLRSLFQLGKYFTIKRETRQALRYINQGLGINENDIAFVNLKGLIYYNNDQFEKAIPWFEKVLALGEQKEYVYEKLAFSYYKTWDFEKAKEYYNVLLEINDKNSDTYFGLAEVYVKERQLDSAKVFIKLAMEVQKPIFAKGYGRLAAIAREEKDLKLAFEYYNLAHEQNPSEPLMYYNMCTVYDQLSTDPHKKLINYQNFTALYPKQHPFFSDMVSKRISELKSEIHFSKD